MKWTRLFALALCVVCLLAVMMVGAALGQDGGTPGADSFVLVQQLGRPRPQGIHYDPNFDRFVMVDPGGRLVLVDGATFAVLHVLYEEGSYSTYTFSHDGRWLALGIDRRVELWNTQTGTLAASATPDEALSIQDPLQFAPDDSLLMINALVPAPAALRRSENDTSNLPYLWDLPAARDEADPSLPGFYTLYAFYDYRYGFVLGPDRTAITALPQRFQVMDLTTNYPILAEIASDRNERDPLYIWRSLRDNYLYVLPQGNNNLFQVDGGTTFEIPLGYDLPYNRLDDLGGLQLSDQAQILGTPRSRVENSLLRLLLGDTYRADWQYHPLTVMLLDFLDPITQGQDQMGLLLYIFDDEAGRGVIEFLRPPDVLNMALHPDGTKLLVRRASGAQPVEVYDLATGLLELTVYPTIPDPDGRQVLAYTGTGDVIVCDFQRFDALTGAVLAENPHYVYGFESYTFTQDSTRIVTLNGADWWLWDLSDGAVIRRATVNLRGDIVAASPDALRFLTWFGTDQGLVVEVNNIATGERRSSTLEALPQREIVNVVSSPDWEHFLVVFGSSPYGPYYPGTEVAIYNIFTGLRWFYAGDDLPPPDAREYGWLDNRTAYIAGAVYESGTQPERVYGLEYHASGLPQCLVDAFPDDWPRWVDLWERFSARLRGDALDRLALSLCAAEPDSVDAVEAVLFPTPTATRLPVSPTPPYIAGVPLCLTSYFSGEARDYAAIWREMTAGKTPEEIADLEKLLCQGLAETAPLPSDGAAGETAVDTTQVLTIDVITGARSYGQYIPFREKPPERVLDLVLNEFERIYRYRPQDARLSPDGTQLALRDGNGFIQVYRLLKPYEALAADATATAAPREEGPQSIAMRPTATQPFDTAGGPRPTLTPTITPTSPPRPAEPVEQADWGTVEE
ncbi:MAG: hypothetical protein OIN84_15295, partial [Candidatus Methanoperedens sp.]|nr:hypothetical protein [Candidatus Methanoperedens sp.]